MEAPTGEQFEIGSGGYRAVVTESGATLRVLEYDGRPLIASFAEDSLPPGGSGQLLVPWPNRIRDGAYSFGGRAHQLPLSEPARHNASHGLVRWAAWTVEEHTATSVTLTHRLMAQSGYPWTLDLRVVHALGPDGLTVTTTAVNRAAEPAPYAQGAHPYLTVDRPVDELELTLPAATRLLTDPERKLPLGTEPVAGTDHDFRRPRRIGATVLDHAFTDLERDPDGRAGARLTDGAGRGVELWADEHFRWLQAYTGEDLAADRRRRSLAVEPMTAPPDAFTSGTDLVVLGPGDAFNAEWGIRALG